MSASTGRRIRLRVGIDEPAAAPELVVRDPLHVRGAARRRTRVAGWLRSAPPTGGCLRPHLPLVGQLSRNHPLNDAADLRVTGRGSRTRRAEYTPGGPIGVGPSPSGGAAPSPAGRAVAVAPCGAQNGDASRIIGAWPRIARRHCRSSRGFAAPRCPPTRARARRGHRSCSCSTASGATSSSMAGLAPDSTPGCSWSASARRSSSGRSRSAGIRVEFTPDGPRDRRRRGAGRLGAGRSAFVDEAVAALGADPQRVFVAGFSQGGIIALALMLRRPSGWPGRLHERPPAARGPALCRRRRPPPRQARPDRPRDERRTLGVDYGRGPLRHPRGPAARASTTTSSTSGTPRARRASRFVSDWLGERLERSA